MKGTKKIKKGSGKNRVLVIFGKSKRKLKRKNARFFARETQPRTWLSKNAVCRFSESLLTAQCHDNASRNARNKTWFSDYALQGIKHGLTHAIGTSHISSLMKIKIRRKKMLAGKVNNLRSSTFSESYFFANATMRVLFTFAPFF